MSWPRVVQTSGDESVKVNKYLNRMYTLMMVK